MAPHGPAQMWAGEAEMQVPSMAQVLHPKLRPGVGQENALGWVIGLKCMGSPDKHCRACPVQIWRAQSWAREGTAELP